MTEPLTVEELIERYDTDPLFHAIVNQVDPGGWTDDDGASHKGPTVFSARRASEIMSVVQPIVDALTAERDGYKRWAGEFDRRWTDAQAERDLALDGHRLADEMIDQLRVDRDRYRKALERIRVAADPGEGGWRHVAKLRRNIAVDALVAHTEPVDT